jgi:hypothetical protein
MKIFRRLVLIASMAFVANGAVAQSNPGFVNGQIPTAAQWNSYFTAKQDALGYAPVNKAGDTLTGALVMAVPGTVAGLNVKPGSAPSAPANGDLWTTTTGVFARINGTTQQLASVAGSVSSVTNSDGTLTISPTSGAAVASLALGHANIWTADQTFSGKIVSTGNLYLGGITSGFPAFFNSGGQLFLRDGTNSTYQTLNLGGANLNGGSGITIGGSSSGVVSLKPQAAAGTYNFNLPTSAGTSGFPLLSGGGGSSPMTFGPLSLSSLAAQAANTVVMNGTTGSAVPTAITIPSCSAGTSALTYNNSTGVWGCNTISAGITPTYWDFSNSTTQSITGGAGDVILNLNTLSAGSASYCNTTTHICTPNVAGTYHVSCQVVNNAGTTAQNAPLIQVSIYKNSTVVSVGVDQNDQPNPINSAAYAYTSRNVPVNGTTDTLSCKAAADGNGTIGGAGGTHFDGQYVAP